MKTFYVVLIVIFGFSLIIFTIIRNNKDKKKLESQLGDDVKKPPVDI